MCAEHISAGQHSGDDLDAKIITALSISSELLSTDKGFTKMPHSMCDSNASRLHEKLDPTSTPEKCKKRKLTPCVRLHFTDGSDFCCFKVVADFQCLDFRFVQTSSGFWKRLWFGPVHRAAESRYKPRTQTSLVSLAARLSSPKVGNYVA